MRADCPFPWLHLVGAMATAWRGGGTKVQWQLRGRDSGRGTELGGRRRNARRWVRPGSAAHLPIGTTAGNRWGTACAGFLALAMSAGATADCWSEGQDAYENLETRVAIRCLESLAAKGHVRAKLNLGIYLRGQGRMMGERSEIARGTELVREAAEAGHIVGRAVLAGDAFEQAKPLSRESWTYWRELLQAFEGTDGIVGAMTTETSIAESRHRYDPALFEEEAANGDRDALMAVAFGYWLKRDRHEVTDRQIVAAFERVANAGDERATYALRWMYAVGDLVPKDPEKAASFMEQALGADYPHAYDLMAYREAGPHRYESRRARDEMKPAWLKWVRNLKKGENPEIALKATSEEALRRAHEVETAWLRKGLPSGNPEIVYRLGTTLVEDAPEGPDGEPDREEGRRLVRKAAELGHPDAARQLGYWYEDGEGIKANRRAAARWYYRAWTTYDALYGKWSGRKQLGMDVYNNFIVMLSRTTGQRPEEYGFSRWWF